MSHGPNPLQPGLRLKQTLRGIERKYFSAPKQKTPLTFDILSDRYSDLYHPHVWQRHGTMGGHHRWSFPYAPRGRIYSSFSRPFPSVYSHHLLWRTFTFIRLLLAQSISPFDFKSLKRISDDKVSPFMLLIRDTLRFFSLWKITSVFTITVVSFTRLLRLCFNFQTNAPSAKYLLSLSFATLSHTYTHTYIINLKSSKLKWQY